LQYETDPENKKQEGAVDRYPHVPGIGYCYRAAGCDYLSALYLEGF
jgi:hypothetical protein